MKHFTLSNRRILFELLQKGEPYRQISRVISKSISSISDEINRNGGRDRYDPYQAHQQARSKQYQKSKRSKLEMSSGLKDYVVTRLKDDLSPEQIAGELRRKAKGKTVICHETIYRYIYSTEGRKKKLWLYLRHRKKPKRIPWGNRKKRQTIIPNRISIHSRPEAANNRTEFGHWEGDLMIFSETNKVLAVFVERMSRKTLAVVNENKTAIEMEYALHELVTTARQIDIRSITFDNGTENVCHQKVREDYLETFATYFCDPYCSWQKGTVENTNKLLRQYLPRHIPAEQITQDYVDTIVEKLNTRPRKCLNYNTPANVSLLCSV